MEIRKRIATTVKYLLIPLAMGCMVVVAVLLTPFMASKIGIYLWSVVCLFTTLIIISILRRVIIKKGQIEASTTKYDV